MQKVEDMLFPGEELGEDVESFLDRLREIPSRVDAWKKSAAHCGADVALSLVRVHFKKIDEEKLKALKVANTKELKFQDFLETFIEAATRIAEVIDLKTFIDPVSPMKGAGDGSEKA